MMAVLSWWVFGQPMGAVLMSEWAGQERRSEPSNKDIPTLLSANSGTLGEA